MSLSAILRAARPSFRDDADRLAFAVHAFMLSLGFRLTATGPAADGDAPLDPKAPEVGPENWQALPDGAYAFRYARAEAGAEESSSKPAASASASASKQKAAEQAEEEKPRAMLVRASTAGDALAVAWCKDKSSPPSGGEAEAGAPSSSSVVPVASIVLAFGDWLASPPPPAPSPEDASGAPSSSSSGDPTSRFKDLAELEAHLKDALERGVGLEGEKKKKKKDEEEEEEEDEGGAGGAGGRPAPRPFPPEQQQPSYPLPPPPHPVPSIGADDLYPPGLGPGMPGIAHPFPGGIGGGGIGVGGSQVGPDHPLFGARHPGVRPPGGMGGGGLHGPPVPGLPPGARWDPIGPPGTPGFLPPLPPPGQGRGRGRGGGGPPSFHPDIMPPGPGGPFGGGSGGGGFSGGFI